MAGLVPAILFVLQRRKDMNAGTRPGMKKLK
jgi:hypothetical protein